MLPVADVDHRDARDVLLMGAVDEIIQESPCKCSGPGYCDTHDREVCKVRWGECRSRPGFYSALAENRAKRAASGRAKIRGIGDLIARVLHITGIAVVVGMVNNLRGKADCGCTQRQRRLNGEKVE